MSICIKTPDSTTNSPSSGLFEAGAGISLASIGVQNVALSTFLQTIPRGIVFATSHAVTLHGPCHESWCFDFTQWVVGITLIFRSA